MVDTHCHLYVADFKTDIAEVITRARLSGVEKFIMPAIDNETYEELVKLETCYPGECYAMMGLHPCSVKEDYQEQLSLVEEWLRKRKFIAIGETGLDFYWDKTFIDKQYEALEKQIGWALQYDIPLVLHTREAMQETIDVIKSHAGKGLKGVFHCFGGTVEQAAQIIDTGFLMGIGGVVTYKKSGLDVVLKDIDLKYILLETDAPYLSPVPYRGKRNESSFLTFIAEKIADIKQVSLEEIKTVTTQNAQKLFQPAP
ncbi:MAG: TatD family hydrolase [Ferruginibacter sp.]